MLLGLLRATTLRPLQDAGVTLAKARAQVEAMSPHSRLFARVAPDLRAVLAEPAREALRHGSRQIAPEHLLLGILHDPESGAVRTLRALGADPDVIRAGLGEPGLV